MLHNIAITNLGAKALEGMMELVESTAIASVEPTADLPENEAWPLSLDNEDSISEERWRPYSTLPIKLCVAVPLQEISLLHLAKMKPGMFLSSSWAAVDDVPLSTSDVFLANVCFEPSGANLGVRITGFAPRTAPVSPRRAQIEEIENAIETAGELDRLNDLRLKTSLCFGTAQVALHELLQLTTGDIIALDRPVNGPVNVTLRGCIVASGRLVLAAGLYAVQISDIVQLSRGLQYC